MICFDNFYLFRNISLLDKSFFRFGATYVGTKQLSPTEAYPVLLGDIDPSGNLNANILHQLGSRLKGKLAAQVQRSKFTAVQMTADYRGDAYTCSVTLGNPDILNFSGKLIAITISYLIKCFICVIYCKYIFRRRCFTLPSNLNTITCIGW